MNNIESISSIKGIKLQSYLATYSLLEAKARECKLKTDGLQQGADINMNTFFAVEFIDDVLEYDKLFDTFDVKQLKNYASDFNLNSKEIKKAIRNFMGIFIKDYNRDGTYFSFMSTSSISEEHQSKILTDEDKITLSQTGMFFLQLLRERKHREHKDLVCRLIRNVLTEDLKHSFDTDVISNDEIILTFLDRITWYFEIDNLETIKAKSLELIPQINDYYNNDIIGKEDILFSYLVQQFESEAIVNVPNVRFMLGKSNLELAFLKFRKNDYKLIELSAYVLNENIIRNFLSMKEKIHKVYPSAEKRFTDMYDVLVTKGKVNLNQLSIDEKSSFQEAIFQLSNEFIIEYFSKGRTVPNSEDSIITFLTEITDYVEFGMKDKSKDFTYRFNSRDMIKKTIYTLFEDCYLDFN